MPATALTVAQGAAHGAGIADSAFQAVDNVNDNSFANDGETVLLVNCQNAGGVTPTLRIPASTYSGNTAVNKALGAIANTKIATLGPFPTAVFGTTVTVGWSTGTSITAAPVKLSRVNPST